MGALRLDREQARRIAVRAQLLDAPRPTDLLAVAQQLTLLQLDPTAAVAPSADLIAWSRLGSSYRPAELREALERDRTLWEFNAMVRPMGDLPLYRAGMPLWPTRWEKARVWLEANDRFRRDVVDLLADSGPLQSREIPDTCQVAWPSTGWTHNRNVTQLLEFLMMRGEVAIAGRRGRQRLWDVAERVYPADLPAVPLPQAYRIREERRLRSLGITRAKRRWGYFALPILHHDRLVGKVDATADRKAGVLRVDAIHEDVAFTATVTDAVRDELRALATWLGLTL